MIGQNNLVNRWFIKVIAILFLLCLTYLILHIGFKGKVENQLNSADITNINLLLNNNLVLINDTSMLENKLLNDTTESKIPIAGNSGKTKYGSLGKREYQVQPDSLKKLVIIYIFSKFPPVSKKDSINTANSLMKFDKTALAVIISQYSFRSKSFFWFTDGWIYLEIIFWSLFGVICSLLYNVSEEIKLNKYDENEEPVHLAKLLYTPFVALIIYLSIDILSAQKDLNVSSYGKGLIVFAFILGYFSRRAIDLLDRIKDIILPGKDQTNISDKKQEDNQESKNERQKVEENITPESDIKKEIEIGSIKEK